MLSPSEFNNAVPKFTNGNYANNPVDPQYIEEPTLQDYNRGVEPLETLPAQWWNWLCNQFTSRFNKINTYVKNIFDEITQLLSLLNISPDGTESAITTGQLKNFFKELYPTYVSDKLELGTTYVPQTRTVNGHALTGNITITKSDVGLGNVDNTSDVDKPVSTAQATAISTAINALDVASVGGSGKYLSAISETDGKISATAGDIDSVVTANSNNLITSGGVAEALHRPLVYNDILNNFNDAWYLGKEDYEGIFFTLGNSANEPIASAYSWFVKTLHKKYQTNGYVITQIAINTDPYMIYTRTAVSTDNATWTWQSWKKIITNDDVTDTITIGNMNSVTSNAVAGAIQNANYVMDIGDSDTPDNLPDDAMRIYRVRNYNIGWIGDDGFIINIPWSSSFGRQIALDDETNRMAIRYKNSGTWSNWIKVLTADDITNQITRGDSALVSSGTLYNFFGGNTSAQSWLGKAFGWALGKNWTQATGYSTTETISCIYYANGTWVVGGSSQGIWWSTDGKSWTQVTGSIADKRILTLYYANGIWLAGTSGNGLWWSTDGKSWTQGTGDNTSHTVHCVRYANNIWVAGTSGNGFWWSTDGKSWIQGSNTTATVYDVYFGDGIWVSACSGKLRWSTDGKNWTNGTVGETVNPRVVYFADNVWKAASPAGILTSTDGKDWSVEKANGNFTDIYYANGVWVAVGINAGAWIKKDTSSWTQTDLTIPSVSVYYANNIWVVSSSNRGFWWSTNGETWIPSNVSDYIEGGSTPFVRVKTVCYGDGTWIAGSLSRAGLWWSSYENASLE